MGYTAKIDDQVVTEVPADQVTITGADFKDQAVETTVVYHANEQHAQLVIIDDDASEAIQRTLQTLTATGKYATAIDFTADGQSLAAILTSWQQRGYTVKSNSFTAGTTYQVDDKQNQFVVHLKHKTQATSRTKTVTQKITYHLPDGTTKVVPRTLTFTQGGTTDLATGETTWDANWTQTQTLAAVASPIYNGYTASAAMAGATQITVTTPTWTTNLDQQIDVYYTPTTTQIPIYYYDENGHPIADPIIVDGNGATNFDEYHKVITGYQFERREIKGADGRLTEVIFYYLKPTNGGEITPPVQPVQPVGTSQPAQPTPTSSGQGTPTAEQELPQTGNQTSETSVLGLTLLGVLGLLGLSKRKRKE